LRLRPISSESFDLLLEETNGHGTAQRVQAASARRLRRVFPSLVDAVRASGHSKGILVAQRRQPIILTEEAGVRLALVLMGTGPLGKARRVDAVARGIEAMASEEAYYWYALCAGDAGRRARRALRLLLAED
jgi:hypothetical protein